MQKQGHRGVVNDRSVIGQNVRPEHALHTRRSLRDESFVHVRKIDSVDTITAKRVTIQRQCHAVQRMYRQRDAPGSASKLASVACRNTLRPAVGKIDDLYSLLLCRPECQLGRLAVIRQAVNARFGCEQACVGENRVAKGTWLRLLCDP